MTKKRQIQISLPYHHHELQVLMRKRENSQGINYVLTTAFFLREDAFKNLEKVAFSTFNFIFYPIIASPIQNVKYIPYLE